MIRVLVADDQALVRGSFRLLVETDPGLEVIGEAATGAEAVEVATRDKPDVLLMDIRMPVMDGIEATRQITASGQTAGVRVLILTTFDLDDYVYAALRAGASGFLLKDTPRAARPRHHPAAHRRVRPPPPAQPAARRRPGGRHRPGTRGAHPDRPRPVKPRDRPGPARHHGDNQNPRQSAAGQARRPRPGAAGHRRLRNRPHPATLTGQPRHSRALHPEFAPVNAAPNPIVTCASSGPTTVAIPSKAIGSKPSR